MEIDEVNDLGDMKQIGDVEESFLAAAIDIISAGSARISNRQKLGSEVLFDSRLNKPSKTILIHDLDISVLQKEYPRNK